jgi:hypothetical protein
VGVRRPTCRRKKSKAPPHGGAFNLVFHTLAVVLSTLLAGLRLAPLLLLARLLLSAALLATLLLSTLLLLARLLVRILIHHILQHWFEAPLTSRSTAKGNA